MNKNSTISINSIEINSVVSNSHNANEDIFLNKKELTFALIDVESLSLDSAIFSYVTKDMMEIEAMKLMKKIISNKSVKNFEVLSDYNLVDEFGTPDFGHRNCDCWIS